jgi:hypothetical protein
MQLAVNWSELSIIIIIITYYAYNNNYYYYIDRDCFLWSIFMVYGLWLETRNCKTLGAMMAR